MDYTQLLHELQQASLFDLFRLNTGISQMLDQPDRIAAGICATDLAILRGYRSFQGGGWDMNLSASWGRIGTRLVEPTGGLYSSRDKLDCVTPIHNHVHLFRRQHHSGLALMTRLEDLFGR